MKIRYIFYILFLVSCKSFSQAPTIEDFFYQAFVENKFHQIIQTNSYRHNKKGKFREDVKFLYTTDSIEQAKEYMGVWQMDRNDLIKPYSLRDSSINQKGDRTRFVAQYNSSGHLVFECNWMHSGVDGGWSHDSTWYYYSNNILDSAYTYFFEHNDKKRIITRYFYNTSAILQHLEETYEYNTWAKVKSPLKQKISYTYFPNGLLYERTDEAMKAAKPNRKDYTYKMSYRYL